MEQSETERKVIGCEADEKLKEMQEVGIFYHHGKMY